MSFLFSQPAPGIVPIDSISFAELAKVDASSVLGNPSGSLADASSITFQDLTQNNLTLFSDTEQGLVPASGGGTSTFLRADGSWATAGISTAGALDQQVLAYDSGTGLTTWQYAGLGDGNLGTNNIILGRGKPGTLTTGTDNVLFGSSAGNNITTATNSFLVNANLRAANESYEININGYLRVQPTYFSAIGIGHTNALNPYVVSIGSGAGNGAVNRSVSIGRNSGYNAGNSAISIGDGAGGGNGGGLGGNGAISIGVAAQQYNGSVGSIAIGTLAAQGATPSGSGYNTIIGSYAGYNLNTGAFNSVLGAYSLYTSNSKNNCVGIGSYAGYNANTANEFYLDSRSSALASNALEKTNSLMYGQFNATPASQTLTINAATTSTYGLVGNNNGGDYDSYIKGLTDDNLLYVDAGNDRVGIGTAAPTAKLEVNGDILASEFRVTNYRLDPTTHAHSQNSAGTHTVNWSASPVELLTVNADTEINLSNPVNGGAYLLQIVQGAGGPYAVTWAAGLTIKWAGGNSTLTSSANAVDIVNLVYISATNTYYAVLGTDFK